MNRFIKKLAVSTWVMVMIAYFAGNVGSRSAWAYYDDTHFVLTYYVARLVGYTPLQAHRIASADVTVDYNPATEPVQSFLPTEPTQIPRWKFHAFRSEVEFPDALERPEQAQKADEAIVGQRKFLYKQARDELMNPGIFLHFLQDEVSHKGYGSRWGHWREKKLPLPMGGTTDWLSYRNLKLHLDMVRTTFQYLSKYMSDVSPYQKPRPLPSDDTLKNVLKRLREVNVWPDKLTWTWADTKGIIYLRGRQGTSTGVQIATSPDLPIVGRQKYEKHLNGPDLQAAKDVIDGALQQMQMVEKRIRREPYIYEFFMDGDDFVFNDSEWNKWVVVGTLKVTVLGRGDKGGVGRSTRVVIWEAPTRKGERKKELVRRTIPSGERTIEIDYLPVGNLLVDVQGDDGKWITKEFTLSKGVDEVTFHLEVNLCALMPKGLEVVQPTYEPSKDCTASYMGRNAYMVMVVSKEDSVAQARQFVSEPFFWLKEHEVKYYRPTTAFGEVGREIQERTMPYVPDYFLSFSRGSYMVSVQAMPENAETMRSMAHEVDEKLKALLEASQK